MKKILCLMLTLCFACCILVACNNSTIADNTEYYDAITKTLKLKRMPTETSSFLDDGIGYAEVDAFTDGDTTRFRLLSDGRIESIRYYSVDTPESTGGVEKWGKAASNFTEKCLENAESIILESTTDGKKAVHDSYGTRWLGYVWYLPKGGSQYKCLNLELVENGFSANTGNSSSAYTYNSYFDKANEFAKSIKLRIYSDLDDPLFTDEPIETTIKELVENPDKFYNVDTKAGSKVKVVGYLASLSISTTDTHTFVAQQYDLETGKVYSYNVYTMYGDKQASKMKLGYLYEIIGDVQLYGSGYQLSGITYSSLPVKNGTTIKQRDYFLTFDSTKAWLSAGQYSATLYSDITVTSTKYENGVLTITGTARQCTGANDAGDKTYGDPVEFTFSVKATQTEANTIVANETVIRLQGYKLDTNSSLITIPSFSAIKKVAQ